MEEEIYFYGQVPVTLKVTGTYIQVARHADGLRKKPLGSKQAILFPDCLLNRLKIKVGGLYSA